MTTTDLCTVETCATAVANGRTVEWCEKHYRRWYEHGDPTYTQITPRDMPLVERAFQQLEIADCWTFTGTPTDRNYGRITYHGSRPYVHRIVWEYLVGPIADGLELDHLCRNTLCANPDHLEPVTHAENMRRGVRWKGWPARRLKELTS